MNKIYDLSCPFEYKKFRKEIKDLAVQNKISECLEYYMTQFRYYFVNENGQPHNLNGPAMLALSCKEGSYLINNISYSKKEYYNHPDVIQYQYLKEHPELEGFV